MLRQLLMAADIDFVTAVYIWKIHAMHLLDWISFFEPHMSDHTVEFSCLFHKCKPHSVCKHTDNLQQSQNYAAEMQTLWSWKGRE